MNKQIEGPSVPTYEQLHAVIDAMLENMSRVLFPMRPTDMWMIHKAKNPYCPVVLYWEALGKERHGNPVPLNNLLVEDNRFIRLESPRTSDVYYIPKA